MAAVNRRAHAAAWGIDVGTTNTKVVRVEIRDEAVLVTGVARRRTPDPGSLVPAVRSLINEVASEDSGSDQGADAVGIASMAETGVPLDGSGQPLGDWLRWDAGQAGTEASVLRSRLGAVNLFEATGVRPAPKVPLAQWAWLRLHQPGRWSQMRRWAGAADLLCLGLTGRLATDHTLAGRTMAYRLPPPPADVPQAFDGALLSEVGMTADQLPDVLGPDALAGPVRDGAAIGSALRAGTPVAIAGHDHAVGAYAVGVRDPGSVADSIGTAEAIYTVLSSEPRRASVAAEGMSLVRTVVGRPALLAGSATAGAMVAWWLSRVAPAWTAAELFDAAAHWNADHPADVPIVLPYASGRQAPRPDPHAEVRIVDGAWTDPADRLAAGVVNGLALQARWMLDVQTSLSAVHPSRVAVLGGPATSSGSWMAAKARFGTAPLDLARCDEPVAVGAAMLALERSGAVRDAPPLDCERLTAARDDEPVAADALRRFVRAASERPEFVAAQVDS